MTKKTKDIVTEFEETDDKIIIAFAKDGMGIKGTVSKENHVIGVLALISALVERCGGDPEAINDAIRTLRDSQVPEDEDEEEPEEKIEVKKLDLSDENSVKEFIELLKKASGK